MATSISFQLDKVKSENLPDPLGFKAPIGDVVIASKKSAGERERSLRAVKEKKAWELAKSPFKNIFMTLIMFYMTGSTVNIFSIMVTVGFLFNPISSLFTVNKVFAQFEDKGVNLALSKLVYLGLNFLILLGALYKFSVMGLLPVNPYDWIHLLHVPKVNEFSSGSII